MVALEAGPAPSAPLDHDILCIDTQQLRAQMACCYLVSDPASGRRAFIDCGTSPGVPRLLALLRERDIAPQSVDYVIPTHVHLDHAGAAGALLRALPQARLVIHPRGARHMIDPAQLIAGATAVYGPQAVAEMYGEILPVPAGRVIEAGADFALSLGQRRLRFLDTPGHARHHFCVWDEVSAGFFAGDSFGLSYREFDTEGGAWVLPTTTPVQFEPDAWARTLDQLLAFAPRHMYLTHYGRVDEVPRLAGLLRKGIDDYVRLALALARKPARSTRLREGLFALALESLRAQGCTLPEARIHELLDPDMDLNAQGLEVWIERRAA